MRPGPLTARLYLRALALVALAAWLSIGVQLRLLVGEDGLLPIAPLLRAARGAGLGWRDVPTLFWWGASDRALVGVVALGAAAALFGVLRPGRAWIALSLPLYLSVCVAAQDFCGFQWDNLLLEASLLALFLDARRPAAAAVWLQRLLLVKLYVESGVAKLLSPVGDWLSGTAMVAYFETAPLPTPLARYVHALPLGVLHASAWAVLVVEIVVPLLVFGPRVSRRIAFVILTAFQLVNFATAGYGFFVPLALALHLWLLDDETLARLRLRVGVPVPASRRARLAAAIALATWCSLSLVEAFVAFTRAEGPTALRRLYAPLRVINVYHLFASVTTELIEPIVEVRTTDEGPFTELAFRYKPGPLDRSPPFVAPHQPRVDFQLWFHGLAARGPLPRYLARIEALLCADPARVAPLFAAPSPASIRAVRVRYARYRFTRPGTDAIWRREPLFARPEHACDAPPMEEEQALGSREQRGGTGTSPPL